VANAKMREYNPAMMGPSFSPTGTSQPGAAWNADGTEPGGGRMVAGGLLVGGTLLYCLAVWFDWLPGLRSLGAYTGGRTWETYPGPPWERFVPVAGIVAAMWAAVSLVELSHRTRRATGAQAGI